ncbi:hypothetical protein C7999DRAFT_38716 [Corynascus novoguineensis]|uniref:Apple domain-containing protein n=1 Tax=Corynascus novoguineensis TaxID=1126955 RepID=A0AAN7HSU0_9PEZI|nr:hypothetical protein C7999DRAFT_38716 [Corynascus novoguineensis]
MATTKTIIRWKMRVDCHIDAHGQDQPSRYYKQDVPNPPAKEKPEDKSPAKQILGLSVPVFWTIAVIAVLVVLGTGVGIGVGVGLSQSRSSSDSPAPSTPTTADPDPTDPDPAATDLTSESPSSTSSAPVTSGTVGLAANSCTFSTPRTFTASDGTAFTQFCFTDWPNNGEAEDGSEVSDLRRLTLYTFEDCMEACVSFNNNIEADETPCKAVTYNSNLTSIIAVGKQGGNCFLKDKKGVNVLAIAESASAYVV